MCQKEITLDVNKSTPLGHWLALSLAFFLRRDAVPLSSAVLFICYDCVFHRQPKVWRSVPKLWVWKDKSMGTPIVLSWIWCLCFIVFPVSLVVYILAIFNWTYFQPNFDYIGPWTPKKIGGTESIWSSDGQVASGLLLAGVRCVPGFVFGAAVCGCLACWRPKHIDQTSDIVLWEMFYFPTFSSNMLLVTGCRAQNIKVFFVCGSLWVGGCLWICLLGWEAFTALSHHKKFLSCSLKIFWYCFDNCEFLLTTDFVRRNIYIWKHNPNHRGVLRSFLCNLSIIFYRSE